MSDAPVRPRWIDSAAEVAELCRRAALHGRVAVDTEADSFHSYHHKLCLVQLSVDGEHALLDPLALGRDGLASLAALLADPGVRKLLHGADYDLRVLHRDLGARVSNLRDTQVAAQLLGEPATGLAALAEKELGVALDKSFQRTDWGKRPLSQEECAYAAADTAYLASLHARLESRLDALGRLEWWVEECEALEQVRWVQPEADPLAFERLKGARALKGAARDRVAALHGWREELASEADIPTFRVLRNEILLGLAKTPPESLADLGKVKGMPRPLVRRAGAELVRLLGDPPPAPPRRPRREFHPDAAFDARFKKLRAVRDEVAAEQGLDPGVVAPRAALEAVAGAEEPVNAAVVGRLLGRRWRAEILAPRLAAALAAPEDDAGPQ